MKAPSIVVYCVRIEATPDNLINIKPFIHTIESKLLGIVKRCDSYELQIITFGLPIYTRRVKTETNKHFGKKGFTAELHKKLYFNQQWERLYQQITAQQNQ